MPIYRFTAKYIDVNNGETSKRFEGDYADYATARTAADNLTTALSNATDAYLYQTELTEVDDLAGAAAASSNVFERVSATVSLSGGDNGNLSIPSPNNAMLTGNALDVTATQWTAVTDALSTSGDGWTISDGENVTGTIRGKRVYVRSGNTNLPS